MNFRRAVSADGEKLLDIWLRSVRATHTFLSEEDIQLFLPLIPDELARLEMWVLCTETDLPVGFMGMSGTKMEALFLAPEILRRGCGRRLVELARQLHGELTVDVNEHESGSLPLLSGLRVRRRGAIRARQHWPAVSAIAHAADCCREGRMTADEFRKLAIGHPEAREKSHMGHPDFRVEGKIFATLGPEEDWGMVKLTPPQQVTFVRAQPAAFKPASGAWGKRGCTIITLREAKKSIVKEALSLAWHNTGPERLLQQDDET